MFIKKRGMAGMGDADTSPEWLKSMIDSTKDIVTAYNQQQIMQANIERARQGLPPINTAAIAPTYNIGLDSSAKMLLIGGGLLLALVLLAGRKRG